MALLRAPASAMYREIAITVHVVGNAGILEEDTHHICAPLPSRTVLTKRKREKQKKKDEKKRNSKKEREKKKELEEEKRK